MILKFISKRLIQGIIVIGFLSIISFLIINAAPGDPAVAIYGGKADNLNKIERQRIVENYGLDKPVLERYIKWSSQMLKGDMGISYIEGRKVSHILKERIPNTLFLLISSIILIVIFSILFGIKAGFNKGSLWDRILNFFSIFFYCIPSFWLGLILIFIFSVSIRILPSSGNIAIDGGGFIDRIKHLIMPVLSIVIIHVGAYARFISEKIKEEDNKYYVMVARANGVLENNIKKGILKNSIIPFINYLGINIPSFFGGTVMIETVFSFPGIGMLMAKSANSRDYPLLMGCIFVTGILVVLTIMIIDIIEIILNPHLRK
ncbi:ABC transporter permease [Clostridium oceanicum]|uniref:ABC transporter permease n=1 Tax=Clostridium oceanicum TaxID=1543 RepID=A0ABP3UQ89_9CLOT